MNLRQIRGIRELTQKQLSELSGIHQQYISEIESGKRSIDSMGIKILKKYCKALNCKVEITADTIDFTISE